LSCETLFQIGLRIAKGNPVALQKRVDLEPRLQSQQASDLCFAQGLCAVALDGKGFQGMARPHPSSSAATSAPISFGISRASSGRSRSALKDSGIGTSIPIAS
jgi:hypothetical protein